MDGKVEFRAQAARDALQAIGERASDLTPLMQRIGALLVDSARERIDTTNLSPEGVPWPQSFRARMEGGPTLYDRGDLRGSLTHQASPREVEVGSNLTYAAIHQTGGTIVPKAAGALHFTLADGRTVTAGSVSIPPRPYLGISDQDEVQILNLVALHHGLIGDGDVV